LIESDFTAIAEKIYRQDSDWIALSLWRSEFRNVLMLYVRKKILFLSEAKEAMAEAEIFVRSEPVGDSDRILEFAFNTGISAYDAEYIYLAELYKVPLVTGDKKIVNCCTQAISLNNFLDLGST